MFTHDECLKIIRKRFPDRAVWNSSKTMDGRYSFLVALGDAVKYDVVDYYETYIVDPETGIIEDYCWGEHLSDPEYMKQRETIEETIHWIDGHPPIPPKGWIKNHPEEWKEFQKQWKLN